MPVDAYLADWLNLILRWSHVIAGIAWIGSSFYFIWLDARLNVPPRNPESSDVAGDLWAVHGGGFYHSQKYQVSPAQLPEPLHWFKWEAYATWLTGFALLIVVYYLNAGALLVDPQVADIEATTAIAASVAMVAAGWLVYDGLCRLSLGGWTFVLVGGALLLGLCWGVTHVFSGRGAYIQIGVMLGTIMAGNVFFIIIPSQKQLVAAKLEGEQPDARLGQRAKQRSVHNNYLTLPVVFTMISPHFAVYLREPLELAGAVRHLRRGRAGAALFQSAQPGPQCRRPADHRTGDPRGARGVHRAAWSRKRRRRAGGAVRAGPRDRRGALCCLSFRHADASDRAGSGCRSQARYRAGDWRLGAANLRPSRRHEDDAVREHDRDDRRGAPGGGIVVRRRGAHSIAGEGLLLPYAVVSGNVPGNDRSRESAAMKGTRARPAGARRVQRHRDRAERSGRTRLEVTVPGTDAELIRALAGRLRAGGKEAAAVRTALAPLVVTSRARNGKELLAFFRASPLIGEDLRFDRDRSPGRDSTL